MNNPVAERRGIDPVSRFVVKQEKINPERLNRTHYFFRP